LENLVAGLVDRRACTYRSGDDPNRPIVAVVILTPFLAQFADWERLSGLSASLLVVGAALWVA